MMFKVKGKTQAHIDALCIALGLNENRRQYLINCANRPDVKYLASSRYARYSCSSANYYALVWDKFVELPVSKLSKRWI